MMAKTAENYAPRRVIEDYEIASARDLCAAFAELDPVLGLFPILDGMRCAFIGKYRRHVIQGQAKTWSVAFQSAQTMAQLTCALETGGCLDAEYFVTGNLTYLIGTQIERARPELKMVFEAMQGHVKANIGLATLGSLGQGTDAAEIYKSMEKEVEKVFARGGTLGTA